MIDYYTDYRYLVRAQRSTRRASHGTNATYRKGELK
jgi:hypothetical protein